MEYIGEYQSREVYWFDYSKLVECDFPWKRWMCLVTANDEIDVDIFEVFVRKAVKEGIVEFKSQGNLASKLHELFDHIVVCIEIEENLSEPSDIITTWHTDETVEDVLEQFFYATKYSLNEKYRSVPVVCTDLNEVDRRKELQMYLERFNNEVN